MAHQRVAVSRTIAAPARQIFAVLIDPRQHPLIDGSGRVLAVRPGTPSRLGPGVRFSAEMKWGVPYRVTNTVVEFEEGRRIAWAHFARHRWRWELEPVGEGSTLVTETFDWSTSLAPSLIERLGYPEKNLPGMEASLLRLESLVTGPPGGGEAETP